LKFCIDVLARESALSTAPAAALLRVLSGGRWRRVIPRQFAVGKSLTRNRRYHLPEPPAVLVIAFIESERLLVQIPAEMRRVNADIGSL
jgi:hypothetical protein